MSPDTILDAEAVLEFEDEPQVGRAKAAAAVLAAIGADIWWAVSKVAR